MRLKALILSLIILLTACSGGQAGNPATGSAGSPAALPPDSPAEVSLQDDGENSAAYSPAQPLTMEETIENYFALQYDIYTSLQYRDISYLIDSGQQRLRNELAWLETLTLRRQLIQENNFCFVDTRQYPYTIRYDEEPEDDRMEFWRKRNLQADNSSVVHFTIVGEKGRAYPPFLAVNSQHTMFLTQKDGIWKIIFHYYTGASRFRNVELTVPGKEEMLAGLRKEFAALPEAKQNPADQQPLPAAGIPYDGRRAAEYAMQYAETPNPFFYDAGDWLGNCANFTSQCIWAGFGGSGQADIAGRKFMTSQWFAGAGGGSPAWENVVYFWNYATANSGAASKGLHGRIENSILQLKPGGIIQTRQQAKAEEKEDFSHTLLLIDPSTLLLAQNSPDNFIYYADLANSDFRYFNPLYLIE